jgi:hypothetical protein
MRREVGEDDEERLLIARLRIVAAIGRGCDGGGDDVAVVSENVMREEEEDEMKRVGFSY